MAFRSEHQVWRDELARGPRRTTITGHLWAIAAAAVLTAIVVIIERIAL